MKQTMRLVCRAGHGVPLVLLILAAAPMVYAGEPSTDAGYSTMTDVSVTATRTAHEVFDVAESLSVVDEAEIESRQATDLNDLLNALPNVNISGGPRPEGQDVNIRGLSNDRILFLIDGTRQNFGRAHNASVFIEPDLMKQVDVLRGPGSALWGSGALGGVVSFTTKDAVDLLAPGTRLGARIKGGYQSVNTQWLTSAAVYGLAGDSLDYLMDVTYRNADNTKLGDGADLEHSGFETLSGLAKLTWMPVLFHTFSGALQTYNSDGEVPSNLQTEAEDANLVDRDTRQDNVRVRYEYDNPDNGWLNPTVTFYRNVTDIDETRQIDGRRDETRFTTLGGGIRNQMLLGADGAVRQTLAYGIDYYHDEAEAQRNGAPRPSFPDAESNVLGVYLQDEVEITDRVMLVPGVRWDRYDSRSNQNIGPDKEESELSLKLGASLKLTDWLSVHAAYNEAFRTPSLSELFTSGVHFTCGPGCANLFVPNPDIKPEKARNKEVGFRIRQRNLLTQGDRARARVSYFRNDVDDFIDREVNFTSAPVPGNPGAGGTTRIANVSNGQLTGYELELGYEAPSWYASASYAQTRGDNEKTDEPLSDIPADEWILKAGMNLSAYGLRFGWQTRIVDDQNRIPSGGTSTDGYTLHDLSLTWIPGRKPGRGMRLDVGIDNLTDKDYREHLSVLKSPGRNIKATLSYKF